MIWIVASIIVGTVLLVLMGYSVKRAKQMGRPKGSGLAHGLAIGMFLSAVVCITLRELGGYGSAAHYFLPCGIAAGGVIGFLLERRHASQ